MVAVKGLDVCCCIFLINWSGKINVHLKVALLSSLDRERCSHASQGGGGTLGEIIWRAKHSVKKTLKPHHEDGLQLGTPFKATCTHRGDCCSSSKEYLYKKTRLASGSHCRRCKSNIQQRVTGDHEDYNM